MPAYTLSPLSREDVAPGRFRRHGMKLAMKATVHQWRQLYDTAAAEPDWVRAHRWGYSEEVASRTIADISEIIQRERQRRRSAR